MTTSENADADNKQGNGSEWPPGTAATGDDPAIGITNLGSMSTLGRGTGMENILSAETDADGWYTGMIPGFSKKLGVRHVISQSGEGDWWEAKVGDDVRPHRYLNKVAAQQGALAEVQRLRIAGQD